MDNKNIKIFVTYKDRHKVIETDIIKPIQTGRAIADEIFEDMIGDDTGDNISAENPKYNELSAQYWVWKNYDSIGNPDYVGFMHYRRHFMFKNNPEFQQKTWLPKSRWFEIDDIDDNYLKIFSDEYILKTIENTDCIVPYAYDYRNYMHKNLIKDYSNLYGQNINHFYLMIDTVKKLFPDYAKTADKVKNGHIKYIANMFIMSKPMFFEYSDFLFKIEQEVNSLVDSSYFTKHEMRFLGFLGEIILTIFIQEQIKRKKYRINELETTFIKDTTEIKNLKPAFEDNNVAIAMSCSNEYTPYLSVCLESLKANSSNKKNYDIVIFERSITDDNKKILKEQIEGDNISLRFYNPVHLIQNYNLKFPKCYNLECYFRLVAPVIFKEYKKLIFTDIDLIFNHDINELYNIDISNYPLGAVQDYIWGIFLNDGNENWMKYAQNTLKLSNPYNYFNTGVMVLNIDEFNKNDYSYKLLNLVSKTQFKILEQDGLNKFFQSNIKYIDSNWNFPVLNIVYKSLFKYIPYNFEILYKKDRQNPKIIHYAGGIKPWHYPEEDFANIWWKYARQTPFYEVILKRMCDQNKPFMDLLRDVKHYKSNVLKYWKYKILQNFVFGKTRKRYVNKKYIFKSKIQNAQMVR